MEIVSKVRALISDHITELGYILDDVIYEKEGSVYFLRIVIDKVGFIDIEDCVKVSQVVNPLLDKIDFINDSYVLDVCSKEKGEN